MALRFRPRLDVWLVRLERRRARFAEGVPRTIGPPQFDPRFPRARCDGKCVRPVRWVGDVSGVALATLPTRHLVLYSDVKGLAVESDDWQATTDGERFALHLEGESILTHARSETSEA